MKRIGVLIPLAVGAILTVSVQVPQVRAATLSETDPAKAALLREAQGLLDARQAADAFVLLSRHELEMAGSPLYDYLLGIAALDSERPRDAAFALERVVAAEPDFAGARMELGRALYELGDLDGAREQFRFLATQSPSPATQTVIDRYLAAIERADGVLASRWSALLQLGGGYDTNANASTGNNEFLGFTLNPDNVETESAFGELLAGVANTLAVGRSSGIVTNLQASHRANPDASFVDQSIASAGVSFLQRTSDWRWLIGVNGYQGWLDGETHEWSGNFDLTATRRFAGSWEFAANARAGVQQYDDESLEVLDVDRYIGGVTFSRLDIGERSGRIGLAAVVGRDEARRDGSPYGNDKLGGRVFASALLRPQSSVYVEASYLETDYRDGLFFGVDRTDDQLAAQLAFEFQNWPAAGWSVSPRLRWQDNDSNVALYDYDRIEAALFVRRSF